MFSDSDDDSTDNSENEMEINNDNDNEINNDSNDNLHLHLHDDSDATCSNTAGTSTDNLTAEVSTHTGHKGMNKDYEHLSTYGSLPLAMKAEVLWNLDDNRWVRGNKYTTKSGDKINFTCRGFPKCPKRMKFLLDPESQDVHVQLSCNEHEHPSSTSNSRLHPDIYNSCYK